MVYDFWILLYLKYDWDLFFLSINGKFYYYQKIDTLRQSTRSTMESEYKSRLI